jgi:BirA family biotin operon repressor/biotin-[acetyl-CoA-carboxylase] ligase
MIYLKLDATHSTNSFLRDMARQGNVANWTVLSAGVQTQGKGQRDAEWFSDHNKNLTFSILIKDLGIRAKDHFMLNWAVSTGIFRVLEAYEVPGLAVKWPNDIMSGASKLAGILIENSIVNDLVTQSIIGIGVNVNQEKFPEGLADAVSIFQLTGSAFDLETVLRDLAEGVKQEFSLIRDGRSDELRARYEEVLFKRNSPHMFRIPGGDPFIGRIVGVSDQGLLNVQKENDVQVHQFAFKEIEYL